MKLVCKMLGGSHSYGLNTPASDTDYRGIFLNTEIKHIIGLDKHEHQQNQTQADEVYTEFRNALKLLRSANTQMVELLFNEDWIQLSDEWKTVIKHRAQLIDSEKLFSCLRGYMQGELKLANGERTGKLGGKRKEAIDKYGYSPKNFVQLFRLAWAGTVYFNKGYFPVNVMKELPVWGEMLLEIKTHPERFDKERLNVSYNEWEKALVMAFENRKVSTYFDEELANELAWEVYRPMVCKL